MIRIAHIITGLQADGAETMLYKLLCRMDRRQFQASVLSLREGGPLAPRIEALGIPVYSARSFPALLGSKPDVLQGWMYHGNIAAQLAAAVLANTPVIWNVRGSHHILRDEKPGTAAAIWLGAKLSRLPWKIVNNSAASAKLHEQYLNFAADRWVIIPNGFEPEQFMPSQSARQEVRAELSIPADAVLIGLIGRRHPMKDHANFIHAAGMLASCAAAHFLLAGAGVDSGNFALLAQLRRAGVLHRTSLVGARTDMPRVMAALDIATSASYSEGFPNVIGEAMCCAVPCVVTDTGDSAWLVGEAGRVVPVRDPAALAGAWRVLIARGPEGRRELGRQGRERIVSRFSMAAVARRYEELYGCALEGRKGKSDRPCAA
jgi:glycosyltransferase involved in cell wall biosynthesis